MANTQEYNDLDIDQTNEEELLTEDDTIEQEDSEESVDDNDELEKLRSENKKLVAIIKRKKEQGNQAPKTQQTLTKTNTADSSIEEVVLKSQGIEEEELDMLKKIATVNGVSLIEAKKDVMFTLWKDKQDAEKRNKKASMPASRGSSSKVAKTLNTPGLTPEEHKALWKSSR